MKIENRFAFLCDLGMLICFMERWCPENSIMADTGEGWRPDVTEEYYRKQGLSTAKVNVHGERRAHDFNFFTLKDGKWVLLAEPAFSRSAIRKILGPIGAYWKNLSPLNDWGGDWEKPFDPYHFQRRNA